MPVITLYFSRLARLMGRRIPRERIVSTLPFLGLDIEEEASDHISVEYSPNRPDFSTDYGVAAGLEGLLGIKTGIPVLKIKKGIDSIRVEPSVGRVRPFIVAIEALNGRLDDETIRQMIAMQEDLHNGIGRRRKKASIGIHDLEKIKFPLVYGTVERNHKFVPLGSNDTMSVSEILANTETGKAYGHLLEDSKKVLAIMDHEKNTISLPPIINSKLTEVTTRTKNLLVEVTALDKIIAEDTLSIIAQMLQKGGFKISSVRISGARNSTPLLSPRKMLLDPALVSGVLGLDISPSEMMRSLKKSRLDAKMRGRQILCTIPRYRTDLSSPIDLVEEVMLGYGIADISPTIPKAGSAGQKNRVTAALGATGEIMVGLGYQEVMNFSLVGRKEQYELPGRDASGALPVADSKTQEHEILRDAILPGLVDTLSRNIHESYPQNIFETGIVFLKGSPVSEETHLACVSAHNDANFTEIKSVLQAILKSGFGMTCTTKVSHNPMFLEGRTADVLVAGRRIGVVGEISEHLLSSYKMRVPAAGFEINLSGLIF
ncbi:MAG: phenylalanine--tRNA ligase subunit beta [Thaumarchaeota archaeon]|nr:phenylalanine--tRNA ligase subunit beta [Nitrososphaerota archaeon]